MRRLGADGVELIGPGGLLGDPATLVLEAGLEAELSDHLGYDRLDPAHRRGPVPLDVPRDRDGSFEPRLVRSGNDDFPVSTGWSSRAPPEG